MRIIRDFSACPPEYRGAAVALGNFDGVHLGHKILLREAKALAQGQERPLAVMTFEPHPREFFLRNGRQLGGKGTGISRLRIESFRRKVQLLAGQGVDALFLVRFNQVFSEQSPQAFVDNVLCKQLAVRHVVTGYNFAFGKNRAGNTAFLTEQAHRRDFTYLACPEVSVNQGQAVSSSAIRALLNAGDVAGAQALLGRPYVIEGVVRSGQKNGRKLGFPTANISMQRLFAPRYGVYAVRFTIAGDSRIYNGVANLGVKPTFGMNELWFEVHAFDVDLALYGKRLCVDLIQHLRDEQRFDSMDLLKAQIERDCTRAKDILSAERNSNKREVL